MLEQGIGGGEHPRPDLHQQGGRRDEGADRGARPGLGRLGRHLPQPLRPAAPDLAPLVGLDRGFTIYDQSDRLRAVKDAMERLDLEDVSVTPERVDAAISRAKNDLVTPEALAKRGGRPRRGGRRARSTPRYQERLRESSAVDFDDLLVHLVTILKEHPDVRAELDARFRYVLVDEYQDTNLAQYAIVRALSVDRPNLCVTGDPDQSIYGWRGANLNNILEFEHDFPGCKVVKLERNYRSTKNILRVADTLIRHNRRRKPKALTDREPRRRRPSS